MIIMEASSEFVELAMQDHAMSNISLEGETSGTKGKRTVCVAPGDP